MNHLRFTIRNQWITRIDRFKPVAKSRNYLYAKFDFLTSEWTGVKTALFNRVGLSQPIGQLINENGICEVPHEVLDFEGDGEFTVSVFCGDLVTVNKATVHVYETGYVDEWGGSQPPTPDVYEQILGRLNSVEQLEVESETLPEGSIATVEKSKNPETGGYIFNFGIPKGDDGEPGENGYSPTIEVSDIEGGHTVTITDKNGNHSFNVMDGAKGDPGDDGYSPSVSIQDITDGHRIVITDATGAHSFDVLNGTDGTDGYSPTVTVTEITGGHRVTITDAQGAHTFDVMDGSGSSITVDSALSTTSENPVQNKVITGAVNQLNEDITELSGSIAPVESTATATAAHAVGELFMMGETLMVALSAIAIGDTITTEGGSRNAAVTTLSSKLLKDVQVNGTSVVQDGVANIPLANGNSTYGAISGFSDRGIVVENGKPRIWTASTNQIKSSSSQYHPITPSNQHSSIFYGLAKAASDTTQSASSNPVGTYTDAAKVAIQKMLGIYEAPWELIREDTFTNATEADYKITVDDNGQTFELTDLILMFETPTQETASAKSGQVRLYMNNGSTAIRHEPGGWTQAASGNAHGIIIVAKQHDGFMESFHSVQNTTGNAENLRYEYYGGTHLLETMQQAGFS